MHYWHLENPYLCFTCFLHTKSEALYDTPVDLLKEHFVYAGQHGAWHVFRYHYNGKAFTLSFYRYRLIIFYDPRVKSSVETDIFIRNTFLPIFSSDIVAILAKVKGIVSDSVEEIFSYGIILAPKYKLVEHTPTELRGLSVPNWLDDGVTTYYYRIFDSSKACAGFIRISKWVTISYGLSDAINRELVNLVYEKVLHSMRRRSSQGAVMGVDDFSLLDGLARFTVPTELSLFLQGLAIKASAFIATLGIILLLVDKITAHFLLSIWYVVLVYGLAAILAYVSWKLIERIIRSS